MVSAGIQVRTGWKWKAEKALEVAESRLRQKALLGLMVWALATSQQRGLTRLEAKSGNISFKRMYGHEWRKQEPVGE